MIRLAATPNQSNFQHHQVSSTYLNRKISLSGDNICIKLQTIWKPISIGNSLQSLKCIQTFLDNHNLFICMLNFYQVIFVSILTCFYSSNPQVFHISIKSSFSNFHALLLGPLSLSEGYQFLWKVLHKSD